MMYPCSIYFEPRQDKDNSRREHMLGLPSLSLGTLGNGLHNEYYAVGLAT